MTLQLMRWVWEDNAAYLEYKRKTNTCFFRITIALCHFEAQILLVSYTKAEKPKQTSSSCQYSIRLTRAIINGKLHGLIIPNLIGLHFCGSGQV